MNNIPAMTPERTHDYLREIGRHWTGQGVAIELGSWFGATAVPLAQGLVEAGYDRTFYCYDRWHANEAEVDKAKKQGVKISVGQNLEPLFLKNILPIYPNVKTVRGSIINKLRWKEGRIEICILDAAKRNPDFAHVIRQLSPHWIPGVTVLGLLDYYFYRKCTGKKRIACMVQERFINANKDSFSLSKAWPECTNVFFRYEGGKVKILN